MKVSAIYAELHSFCGDVRWAEPIRLAIHFDDDTYMRLRGGGDGQQLIIDTLPLEPSMHLEEFGRTDTFDFTGRMGPELSNMEVGQPIAIRIPGEILVGLALPRANGEYFCIWVNGDEFHWGSAADLHSDGWVKGFEPMIGRQLSI